MPAPATPVVTSMPATSAAGSVLHGRSQQLLAPHQADINGSRAPVSRFSGSGFSGPADVLYKPDHHQPLPSNAIAPSPAITESAVPASAQVPSHVPASDQPENHGYKGPKPRLAACIPSAHGQKLVFGYAWVWGRWAVRQHVEVSPDLPVFSALPL